MIDLLKKVTFFKFIDTTVIGEAMIHKYIKYNLMIDEYRVILL